jgi:hypothetical protein
VPAALGVALCATDRAGAEVRVSLTGSARPTVSAVIEMYDLDAESPTIWSPVTAGDRALLLNPEGDSKGDGPPSIRINPITRLPEVVWALRSGRISEVVWSRFDGTAWREFKELTSGGRSLDPRLWIDEAGTRRVAFWRRDPGSESDTLLVTTLPHGEKHWWKPQRISLEGVETRHPDIRSYPDYGTVLIAEEQTPQGTSISVFDLPKLDEDDPPQRDSDPWGRQQVYLSEESGGAMDLQLLAIPGSGGMVPQIQWVEDSADGKVGVIYYDTQSLTWSIPIFVDESDTPPTP